MKQHLDLKTLINFVSYFCLPLCHILLLIWGYSATVQLDPFIKLSKNVSEQLHFQIIWRHQT